MRKSDFLYSLASILMISSAIVAGEAPATIALEIIRMEPPVKKNVYLLAEDPFEKPVTGVRFF